MVYNPTRESWWLTRCSSPEYQRAYDVLAKLIPPSEIVLEVACGQGELARRIAKQGNHRLVIGADYSPTMLEQAKKMCDTTGVVYSNGDATTITPSARGLIWVIDNLLDSNLPDNLADLTLFTFPELGEEITPQSIDTELMDSLRRKVGKPLNPTTRVNCLVNLRAHYHLARITKPRGGIITIVYDISLGADSSYDQLMFKGSEEMGAISGLRLLRSQHFSSEKIWGDTHSAEELEEIKNSGSVKNQDKYARAQKGYRVNWYKNSRKK